MEAGCEPRCEGAVGDVRDAAHRLTGAVSPGARLQTRAEDSKTCGSARNERRGASPDDPPKVRSERYSSCSACPPPVAFPQSGSLIVDIGCERGRCILAAVPAAECTASHRRSRRCCRFSNRTDCPLVTSSRRWSSSLAVRPTSPTTTTRLTGHGQDGHAVLQGRDLPDRGFVYVCAEGVRPRGRGRKGTLVRVGSARGVPGQQQGSDHAHRGTTEVHRFVG